MTRSELAAGDVLSYSAGTTQSGPDGFRFLRRAGQPTGADMLGAVAGRWPELIPLLGTRPPLVLNGYPASTGDFAFGVQVDSYLSFGVAQRALRLARREGMTTVLLAQPLWAAELLFAAADDAETLPSTVVWACGGYPLPWSLEAALRAGCESGGCRLEIVQLYGIAELDAGCLVGRERRADGRVVYHPRDDVRFDAGDELRLARRQPDGSWSDWVSTGDFIDRLDGSAVVIRFGTRVAAEVATELESWDPQAWRRRTGYLRRADDEFVAQLRVGFDAADATQRDGVGGTARDEDHFDFARATGASWLTKPDWRGLPS